MDRVAIDTTDIIFQVLRPQKIAVFLAEFMTVETTSAGVGRGKLGKTDDFLNVTAAFDVGLPWTVTRFTALPLGTALLVEFGFPVRTVIEALAFRIVACRA